MFKAMKQIPTDAVRWFRNGDHPKDHSRRFAGPATGEDPLTEGEIVRRYAHPQVSGNKTRLRCLRPAKAHGWLDQGDFSVVVCPGDWVVTVVGGYRVIPNDTFITLFDEPALEELQSVGHSDEPKNQYTAVLRTADYKTTNGEHHE